MVSRKDANKARLKRHKRVRAKISGTADRPRLCVYRSNAHISAQVIDDVAGVTLVSASTHEKEFEGNCGNKGLSCNVINDLCRNVCVGTIYCKTGTCCCT